MSEQWSTNWDDYGRPPLSEFYTGRAVLAMSAELAADATAQAMAFLQSLRTRPDLSRSMVGMLLLDEASRRTREMDPTAPLFVAMWLAHIDYRVFDDVIEGL